MAAICAECRHVKTGVGAWKCKAYTLQSYVRGTIWLDRCYDHNLWGNCQKFEPRGRHWWEFWK